MAELRLVSDDYGRAVVYRGVRIVAAPEDRPPFPVDALVLEEDTHLLMSARAEIRAPAESFGKLVNDMADFQPLAPGTVLARGNAPLRLLAVVHDIDRRPTWREAWVDRALAGVLQEAARRRLESLGVPVLAGRHGSMAAGRFAALLRRALERRSPGRLRRLWILAPETDCAAVLGAFR